MEKENNDLKNSKSNLSPQDGNVSDPAKKPQCCTPLKLFLVSLCFTYFAKGLSGSYMKSSITQIERRFDISSSTVGLVDGCFELGNLLMIALVSYFGARFHRPRLIAAGCIVMALGSFLTAMPHFFMGPYRYESARTHRSSHDNSTFSSSPCLANVTVSEVIKPECMKEGGSYMWIYVLIGNMLRGVGESPITPLGISYIDDFSGPENTPLYIACLHTVALFGPMMGFMLGSFCAKQYVDIGFVDLDSVTITPQDTRWVGAWWIGFLVAGVVTLMSGIPFCFLPKSMTKEGTKHALNLLKFKESEKSDSESHKKTTLKGFFVALKKLGSNRLYVMLMCLNMLQLNSFLGYITYKPKYMEQQYGQSISKSNFFTGITTLPAAALGMLLGGLVMKKYKFGLLSACKMSFVTSFTAFILSLSLFMIGCENNDVAGITITYNGSKLNTFQDNVLSASCNSNCRCSTSRWDPVCGENGVTYMSACLAGCRASTGEGKDMVFQNCSCLGHIGVPSTNASARLGTCPRSESCDRMFLYYIISQVVTTVVYAVGGSAAYVLVLWIVTPDLKALAVGVYMLLVRMLAGIPAPIYFGALIDRTCLKWGTKLCGGRGACRMYDATSFRNTFLGLTTGIWAPSFILFIWFIFMVKKRLSVKSPENGVLRSDATKKEVRPDDATKEDTAAIEIEKETFI
ncbi:solute carrier organic anion transporter family member 1C1-like [Pseudophryne corroboree]|uniref:solute carrier organic anion transporter family member 1C1-like n=1 Tax=Pseudophryne corroboree TaxID=495146 RepID=UPI0030813A79